MGRALPIGLDVGTSTVRMLQMVAKGRRLSAVEAAKYVIPQEARRDPAEEREAVVRGIRQMLREGRFKGRDTVMALRGEDLAIRNIRMAKMPPEELPTAVNWEIQNKFPFDTTQAVTQFLPAGEVRQGDQLYDEVIVLAAPREVIDERIALAEAAGLDVVSLDAEPCSVLRSFDHGLRRAEDDDGMAVVVNIGARTTVVVSRGREIVFIKSVPIGGTLFNRAVAECLELAPVEAEALRRRLARRDEDEDGSGASVRRAVVDAIRPHLEELAGEISLCLRYFTVTFRAELPDEVTFTGGEAHHEAPCRMLAERLGMECLIGDPLRGVRTSELGQRLDRRGCVSEWNTAVGLALKGRPLAASASPTRAA